MPIMISVCLGRKSSHLACHQCQDVTKLLKLVVPPQTDLYLHGQHALYACKQRAAKDYGNFVSEPI